MRGTLASLALASLAGQPALLSQTPPGTLAAPLVQVSNPAKALDQILPAPKLTGLTPGGGHILQPLWPQPPQKRRTSRWVRHFGIDSFGYSPKAGALDFTSSPGYTSALFNLQNLECPGCLFGPLPEAPLALPPFGADVAWKLGHDRVELFSGFGGVEAFGPNGWINPVTRRFWTGSSTNGWLTETKFGGRFAVDSGRHLWLGGSGHVIHNYGPGLSNWKGFGGDATFRFGH